MREKNGYWEEHIWDTLVTGVESVPKSLSGLPQTMSSRLSDFLPSPDSSSLEPSLPINRFNVRPKFQYAACNTHHYSRELNESKTSVELCLFVLDNTDIGGGENSVRCQRTQY